MKTHDILIFTYPCFRKIVHKSRYDRYSHFALHTDKSGIEPRKVRILTLAAKVGILTLPPDNSRIVQILTLRRPYIHVCYFPISEYQRRCSDCEDVQAGLHLCCSQIPENRFSCTETHMILVLIAVKQRRLWCAYANAQTRQSLRHWHTQSVDLDGTPDQS